jgi:hypothetical protein
VKLNLKLSLAGKPAQRCTKAMTTETQFIQASPTAAGAGRARKDSPFDLLTARSQKPVRIPPPIINARPVFRGDKSYLRALRAAEMAIWSAKITFPTFIALLLALAEPASR